MSARRWTALLWTLAGAVALLLLLKFFVADVYRVDSGSMRPTLFGGRERPDGVEDAEHVLVLYRRAPPARFDLVVIRSPDGSKPLVKRVCGLPGDLDLMIRGGDLFIGRERLPPEVPRPAPVPVYDDRYQEPEQFFEFRRDGSVRRAGSEWIVDGDPAAPGNLLKFHPELRDDYLDRRNRRVPGVVEVNDAELELEFALEAPGAGHVLRLQLSEEGDLFEVELEPRAQGGAELRLLRSKRFARRTADTADAREDLPRELASTQIQSLLVAGAWYDLCFSNIDNHLRVRSVALALELGCGYEQNLPLHEPGATEPGSDVAHNLGPRVLFGVQGGRARFRAVRILRDLFYTQDGRFGVRGSGRSPGGFDGSASDDAVSLGPDDYFLLGDNSAASTDSRHFGPRQASELLGRPLAVVWPTPRWLHPTRPP